jgi:hypothetical protein
MSFLTSCLRATYETVNPLTVLIFPLMVLFSPQMVPDVPPSAMEFPPNESTFPFDGISNPAEVFFPPIDVILPRPPEVSADGCDNRIADSGLVPALCCPRTFSEKNLPEFKDRKRLDGLVEASWLRRHSRRVKTPSIGVIYPL